jgi:hypothetical protein
VGPKAGFESCYWLFQPPGRGLWPTSSQVRRARGLDPPRRLAVSGPARRGPLFGCFVCACVCCRLPFLPGAHLAIAAKVNLTHFLTVHSRFFFFVSRFISLSHFNSLGHSLFLNQLNRQYLRLPPGDLARSLDFHRLTRSAPRQNAFVYGARRRLPVRCCGLWHSHQRCRRQRRPDRPRSRELAHCPCCVRNRPCQQHSGCPNVVCLADRLSVCVINNIKC